MNFFNERNPLWILIDIALIIYAIHTGDVIFLLFIVLDSIYTLFWIFAPESTQKFMDNIFVRILLVAMAIIVMLYVVNILLSNI